MRLAGHGPARAPRPPLSRSAQAGRDSSRTVLVVLLELSWHIGKDVERRPDPGPGPGSGGSGSRCRHSPAVTVANDLRPSGV